ncbi:MAG: immune inhibitor A [Anaerolineaceae bacterium]|nr:immune inhibitor A [Anaerolineaceae bacterium]
MNNSSKKVSIIVIVLLVFTCCLLVVCIGLAGASIWGVQQIQEVSTSLEGIPTMELFDLPDVNETPVPVPTVVILPETPAAYETLRTLQEAVTPNNDLRELAMRLGGKSDIPAVLETDPIPYQLGDQEDFWVSDLDTNETYAIKATLRYATEHVYFWIENGVNYNEGDLIKLVDTFESQIYPTNREFFGGEWSPGIDNDPHLYIVYARGLGSTVAGYFSSADSVHPMAHEYSNGHETFMVSADNNRLNDSYLYGVLAHEFQHMIHWFRDKNETTWLNEGFSELAVFINEYYSGGFDFMFASQPDMQLNHWPNDNYATTPHYGAAFLFVDYFLDRFGEDATKALVNAPENGMESIDTVLSDLDIRDPLNGNSVTANDVFADWVVTNYLLDPNAGDGRYVYHNNPGAPGTYETEWVSDCSPVWQDRTVHQYGADYIRISCAGKHTLEIEGSTEVALLPESVYSGEYAFWSNQGDDSDMTLTRQFDFSEVGGELSMSYWTWYDIEEGYDYVYLAVSEDAEKWQLINTPSGTIENPSGNSYGWAYTGLSGGDSHWIQEIVDLSDYAGKKVYLRFEYVTDAAVNGEGMLIDDVAIPQIGYFTDFEDDDQQDWESEGFVRVQNRLPQSFTISLIRLGDGDNIVETLQVEAGDKVQFELDEDQNSSDAVLVVSGTTRFTRQLATYRFRFDQ